MTAPVWVIYRKEPWGLTRLGRMRAHKEEAVWEAIRRDPRRYRGDIVVKQREDENEHTSAR